MSSESICPSLYRDEQGNFYCAYADGKKIDPGVMPCLGTYWECPIYTRVTRDKERMEEETKEPESIEHEEGISLAEIEEEKPEVEEIKREEEDILRKLETLESRVIDLNHTWEEYERNARRVLEDWDELREETELILSGINSLLESYEKELRELDARFKLGLLSENTFNEIKSEIDRKAAEYLELKDNIEYLLQRIERVITPHFRRIKVSEVKPELAKLRLSLNRLENMFKEGRISEETYERVKRQLEKQIARLEKLKGEVE